MKFMSIWPPIVMLSLLAMSFGMTLMKAGEPKTGTHNPLLDLFGMAISVSILYWGGFFDPLLR